MIKQMYKGNAFSPQTILTQPINSTATTIDVADSSVFPIAPNFATIGNDENGETILYTSKGVGILSGITRGIEGVAKAWGKDELIARNFTYIDHATLIDNITTLETSKVDKTTTINGKALTGDISITKSELGLSNVDNTADIDKPVSINQQTALDLKSDKTQVATDLAKKADKTQVTTDLAKKADKTDLALIQADVALKADKTDLDLKADIADINDLVKIESVAKFQNLRIDELSVFPQTFPLRNADLGVKTANAITGACGVRDFTTVNLPFDENFGEYLFGGSTNGENSGATDNILAYALHEFSASKNIVIDLKLPKKIWRHASTETGNYFASKSHLILVGGVDNNGNVSDDVTVVAGGYNKAMEILGSIKFINTIFDTAVMQASGTGRFLIIGGILGQLNAGELGTEDFQKATRNVFTIDVTNVIDPPAIIEKVDCLPVAMYGHTITSSTVGGSAFIVGGRGIDGKGLKGIYNYLETYSDPIKLDKIDYVLDLPVGLYRPYVFTGVNWVDGKSRIQLSIWGGVLDNGEISDMLYIVDVSALTVQSYKLEIEEYENLSYYGTLLSVDSIVVGGARQKDNKVLDTMARAYILPKIGKIGTAKKTQKVKVSLDSSDPAKIFYAVNSEGVIKMHPSGKFVTFNENASVGAGFKTGESIGLTISIEN